MKCFNARGLLLSLLILSLDPHSFGAVAAKKPQKKVIYRPSRPDMGLGFTLGYEATLGNAVSYHYMPKKYLEFFGGAGYNKSGVKIGGGGAFLWYLNRKLGLRSGAALVFSSGTSGEVAVDAQFTPENTNESEAIQASKTYDVSSAVMFNTLFGGFWAIAKDTHLIADVTYNAVLAGNEVTFSDDIQFSRDIEATNHSSFEKEFDEKAVDEAEAGGLGFNVGIRFLW